MFLNVYFHQTTNIYNYTEPKLKVGRKLRFLPTQLCGLCVNVCEDLDVHCYLLVAIFFASIRFTTCP